MTPDGQVFKAQKGNRGARQYRYYKAGRVSLPSGDVENIVRDTLRKFLDSDMAGIPDEKRLALKQVEYTDGLVSTMLEKVVYHENKLTLFISIVDLSYLAPFKTERMNTAAEPMHGFYISEDSKYAVAEKQIFVNRNITLSYHGAGNETMVFTKSENASVLIHALALGWRYKRDYERGVAVNEMERTERKNKRTIYKYLDLVYLSPRMVDAIMDSEVPAHVNLQTLFGIASKYEDFEKQEQAFFGA